MARHDAYEWADDAAAAAGAWTAAALFTALLIISMEAARIYRGHGFTGGTKSRILWGALAGFFASIGFSIYLLQSPTTAGWSTWPASIGFLVWVLVIEFVDQSYKPPANGEELDIEDVLGPWRFYRHREPAPRQNGWSR